MPRQRNIFIDRVRCSSAICAIVLCGIATSLTTTALPACFAAQPEAADAGSSSDDSVLSHSAVPRRDRVLQERLRRAEAMIARREFASAIAEILDATKGEVGAQILANEVADVWQEYRDSRSVLVDLLRSLPSESFALYLRQTEPLARGRFHKAVRDSEFEILRTLPFQFPMTDAARDALRFLAAWHLDRHEFAAADATARRLLRDPSLSSPQRVAALRTIELCAGQMRKRDASPAADASSNGSTTSGPTTSLPSPSMASPSMASPSMASESLASESAHRSQNLPLRAKLFPFLARPDWQVSSGLDDESTTLARHALHEHFEQSIPILPQAQPLVVGGIVVRRSLTDVSAHELESGRLLWSEESESEAGQSASRLTMNLSLQELMAQKLARGLQVDSLQSRLSSDGECVFTVESGAGAMSGYVPARSGLSAVSSFEGRAQNRIVARQLRTGKVLWNVTADSILDADSSREISHAPRDTIVKDEPPGTPKSLREVETQLEFDNKVAASDVYFCGLPTPVDRHVLGLVQVADSLRLYAADRNTGRIDWSLDVAEVARLSPSDIDWRSLDGRITLIDGVLVCPTGAGLLVGVDLATRSVIWSRRYTRADVPLEVTRLPFAPARPQRPWWLGWRDNILLRVAGPVPEPFDRDSAAHLAASILIAASPDAESINAIDPRTGQRLWTHRLESPVDLISNEDRIIVVARHFVSALKVQSGEVIWKVPCREPVGTGYTKSVANDRGDVSGTTFYVFPVRGGSLVAMNCENGEMIESVDRLESLSGCLISAGDRLIAMNPDLLSVWPNLSIMPDRRSPTQAVTPAETSVVDSAANSVIEQAAFDRSCGLFSKAATRLRKQADSPQAKAELQKTLLAWLDAGTLSAQQIANVELEAEQLAGETSIADLIAIRHAAARAAATSGDPVASLNFYAKLQSLNPSGEPRFLKPEPLRSVRHDRLIQGELLDLLESRDERVTAQLAQTLVGFEASAERSRDPFALQRFTRQWGNMALAARAALDDRSRIGLRYGQKQLALLAVADSSDRDVSVEASSKLIELYESRSYDRDADAVRRDLRQGGFDIGPDSKDSLAGSPWNAGPVSVSEHPEQNLDTTFIPVPVECSPGSLFDRLNVAINPRSTRNDTILRFYGDGFSGSWQTVLPTSASPLKSVARTYRGWGIGHLLVIQLGAELFGISPFDGSGEPRVQRLWSLDMAGENRQEDHEYAPAVPGFAEEQLTMLDAFGRPIAKVGPVQAGYLCFQTRGKLVCIDTSSGQRLWQRYQLPRQAICSGDGQNVFLIQPREDSVTVLRVVDGAAISKFRLSDIAGFRGTVLQVSGRRVLMAERSSEFAKNSDVLSISRIVSVSLRTENVEWSAAVDPAATVFAVGSDWLGIVEVSGKLRVVDHRSGQEISTFTVQRPEQIRAVHVASDASTHVVAFSDTAESTFLNGRSAGGGRNPAVTGLLVAIDAATAKLKWQRTVDQIRFLVDQPKNAPCIVLSYRRSRSTGTESMESVLHIINRETGDDILNRRGSGSASDFTFEPHADQNRLSIRMARKSIRLTFSPRQTP